MSKLQHKMKVDVHQKVVDSELNDVYKQIKALELKSKCTVSRDFRKQPGVNQYSPGNNATPKNKINIVKIENVDEDDSSSQLKIEEDNPP